MLSADSLISPDPATTRHVHLRRWNRDQGLATGSAAGTASGPEGLRIHEPVSVRSYTDPFGDAGAVDYEQASWTTPWVRPGFGLTELVVSWNARTPPGTWIEVAVRAVGEGDPPSEWYVLGRWCSADPADGGAIHRTSVNDQASEAATVRADTFAARNGHTFLGYQVRVNLLRRMGSGASPVVAQIVAVASATPEVPTVGVSPRGAGCGITLAVPSLSQEVHVGHYPKWDNGGQAWCSATSTAMILRYWGTGPSAADLAWVEPEVDAIVDHGARNVFDYAYGGAGNWPFNTAYAATFGLVGFVTRLRDLTEAEAFIAAGIPLVVSASFERDELTGAGYRTDGHLMVIAGFTDAGDVVANDPASHLIADNEQVRVVYDRAEFEKVWVPRSGGIAYVICPPGHRLPAGLVPAEPNW